MLTRKQSIFYGALLGGWFAFLYAFGTQVINWLFMPGIPLEAPQNNNFVAYLLIYVSMGAVLGVVSALPSSTLGGVALGGFVSALLVTIFGLLTPTGGEDTIWRKLILFLYTFLPLVVLLMPVAYLIRTGVNAQVTDPDRPHLWARRYMVLGLLSALVLVVVSFSLHNRDSREGFFYVNQLILDARNAYSAEQLPEPLQDVQGYWENAKGGYVLSWSDKLEAFMGPQPVGLELSQFVIIARFENGFAFGCIFQPGGSRVPNCTNF